MNLFQSTTRTFRRGGGLTDDYASRPGAAATTTASAASAKVPVPPHRDDVGERRDARTGVSPALPGPSGQRAVDLSALLTAAQPPHTPQPAPPLPPRRRPFPSMPYYGLLSSCEVHVDIPTPAEQNAAGAVVQAAPRQDPEHRHLPPLTLRNPPMSSARFAEVHRHLSAVAAQHGTVYCLGTGSTLTDNLRMVHRAGAATAKPSSPSAGAAHSGLTYGAYTDALQSMFCEMSALRDASLSMVQAGTCSATTAAPATHHTAYVRLAGHPAWKEVSAMLCVEQGRLLFCICATSRVTQKRLSAACDATGAVLEWFGGAALVAEPRHLPCGDANPVWVAWDALRHLPLLSTSAAPPAVEEEESSTTRNEAVNEDGVGDASAGVRAVLRAVRDAATVLVGFHVSLLASLPFRGSTPCAQVGRITEEAAVLAQSELTSSPSRVVGRRFVWRLLPPPSLGLTAVPSVSLAFPTSAASARLTTAPCAVLPFFVTKLLECLVDVCGLTAFRIHCGAAAAIDGAAPVTAAGQTPPAQAATGPVGVRLVHSSAPSLLTLRRGPSSTSWTAFSRLSSAGAGCWIDAETREGLRAGGLQVRADGLASAAAPPAVELGEDASFDEASADADDGDDADDDEVEMEFELTSIDYERCSASDDTVTDVPLVKRPRSEVSTAGEGVRRDALVDPTRWGDGFAFRLSVKRVVTVDAGDT